MRVLSKVYVEHTEMCSGAFWYFLPTGSLYVVTTEMWFITFQYIVHNASLYVEHTEMCSGTFWYILRT